MPPDKCEDTLNGYWIKCGECNEIIYNGELSRNLRICPKCNSCFPLPPAERIASLADDGSLIGQDTGNEQAIMIGEAALSGNRLVIAAVNMGFTDRDTSLIVCEGIIKAIVHAADQRLPLLMICTNSNGQQTQNETLFPAQILSINAAMSRLNTEKLLYVSILACSNSRSHFPGFACIADVVIAESNMPGVALDNNRTRQNGTAQTAQILFQNGMADMIVPRKELKRALTDIFNFFR